jgi:drug/metabolite transporter (DMT)-like permease
MVAFAANSVLCRMSLGQELIDPTSFTTVRVASGALCLAVIIFLRDKKLQLGAPRGLSVLSLFAYMVCFSFAYVSLSTGTGALLLFGFVQFTMISVGLIRGERLSLLSWLGLMIAVAGLIYLLLPGVEAPDLGHSVLMAAAGIAWGAYSLLGKGAADPTASTASNFIYATPLALIASIAFLDGSLLTQQGIILAAISGAVTSGLGYAIWYRALQGISATSAAVVQLSVPAIATFGGVIFMSESLNHRVVLATVLTLGGIALVLASPAKVGA